MIFDHWIVDDPDTLFEVVDRMVAEQAGENRG